MRNKPLLSILLSLTMLSATSGCGKQKAGDFLQACRDGDVITVKEMLKENPELVNSVHVDPPFEGELSALHLALAENHLDIAELLTSYGADLNHKNGEMQTPLHYAVSLDNEQLVETMLDLGAEINAKDSSNKTPLYYAIDEGKWKVVKILHKYGAIGTSKIHEASAIGNDTLVRSLVSHDSTLLESIDIDGNTPLHKAVENGRIGVSKYLITTGANPNAVNAIRQSPMHLAARMGNLQIARLLTQYGADIQLRDVGQQTPLHYSCKYGKADIVEYLLKKGASHVCRDDIGYTPLHYAAIGGSLDRRLNIQCDYVSTIKILLSYGADTNARVNGGKSPLDLAYTWGHADLVKIMMGNGVRGKKSPI